MKKLAALLLVSSLANASALHLGGWSKHFGGNATNESHQMVMVEYKHFLAGTMLNSYSKRSYMLGGTKELYDWQYAKVNGSIIAVTGYSDTSVNLAVYPMIMGSIEFKTPYVRPTIHLNPMFAMFALTVRF